MSSPSPSKSFRSRMGGVMRRTSSVLAMASAHPSTPTPSTTPAPPSDEPRRSSVPNSVEGRRSTGSLTPSAPPEPAPELPPVVITTEDAPEPTPASVPAPEPEPAPVQETAPPEPPVVTEEPDPMPTPAPEPTPLPPTANGTHKAVKCLLPVATQYQMYPSPIAESPAREAEETTNDKQIVAPRAEDSIVPAAPGPVVEVPAPQVEDAYVPPPPMLDGGSNHGAFTEEPMDMHPSELPVLTVEAPVAAQEPAAPARPEPIPVPVPAPALDDPEYFDLVPNPAVPVHEIPAAEASPGSETVIGAEDRHDAHVSPYPYDLQPARTQVMPETGVEPVLGPRNIIRGICAYLFSPGVWRQIPGLDR